MLTSLLVNGCHQQVGLELYLSKYWDMFPPLSIWLLSSACLLPGAKFQRIQCSVVEDPWKHQHGCHCSGKPRAEWMQCFICSFGSTQDLPWGPQYLVPWPGMEPKAPALRAWSLNHWTTRQVTGVLLKEKTSMSKQVSQVLLGVGSRVQG